MQPSSTAGIFIGPKSPTPRTSVLSSGPASTFLLRIARSSPKGFRTNGWFIGFAGAFQSDGQLESSEVKLAVLVLLARAHGSQAAEAARPIFETYANQISHR